MEDGAKINVDVDVDVEAKLNVDVWNSEEKGVHEHFEAQMHVDDKSDDEGHTPAEKVIQNWYLRLCLLFFYVCNMKLAPKLKLFFYFYS